MQELKRVLGNWKFIGMLLLLLIINGWYTFQNQQPEKEDLEYYEQYYEGNYMEDEKELYLSELKDFQGKDLEEAKKEIEDFYADFWYGRSDNFIHAEDVKANVYGILQEQIEYILGYSDYLAGIKVSAENMKTIAALGTEGGFSRKNIDKTVKDFEKLKGIEISLDNEQGVNAFVDCFFSGMLLMVLSLIVVIIMLQERKKGLWQFVYSMPKGRSSLALKRAGILCLSVTIGGILLESENLLITGWYHGGFGNLNRMVQSNPAFSGCVIPMKMGTFLALLILMKILVCAFLGCVLWLLASSIKSNAAAFASLAMVLAVEYYGYTEIAAQSVMNKWKFLNLFAFLDSGHVITSYQNLNFFGNPVSSHMVLLGVMPLMLVLVVLGVTISGRRKPFAQKDGLLIHGLEKVIYLIKPYRHSCHLFHECYKVFVKQRVALMLVILAVGCALSLKSEDIYYNYETTLYNNYMEQIQGKVTPEKMDYLVSETELWQQQMDESKYKLKRYHSLLQLHEINGSEEYLNVFASDREVEAEREKIKQYQSAKELLESLSVQGEKMQELQKENVDAGFVNRIGYGMYLGKGGESSTQKQVLVMLLSVIITLAGLKSYETSQNADKFLKSLKKGRTSVFYRKCVAALFVTGFITGAVSFVGFSNTYHTYGMSGFDLSVLSLEMFEKFPVNISLGQMLGLVWILRFIMLYAVAMIVIFLSGRTKNMLVSMFLSALVLLIPAGLVHMGFEPLSMVSVLRPVTVTHFWNVYGFEKITSVLPCIVLGIIGVISFFIARRDSK